jgi:hypothetical protein
MVVPLPLALILCLAGLILFGVATTLMAKRIGNELDPLTIAGLSAKERNAIDTAIRLRQMPQDATQRELAMKRAEFFVRTDPVGLRWMLWVYLGVFLALFGLDSIPVVSTVTLVVQGIVVLFCANSTFTGWRMFRFCKEFLSRAEA